LPITPSVNIRSESSRSAAAEADIDSLAAVLAREETYDCASSTGLPRPRRWATGPGGPGAVPAERYGARKALRRPLLHPSAW